MASRNRDGVWLLVGLSVSAMILSFAHCGGKSGETESKEATTRPGGTTTEASEPSTKVGEPATAIPCDHLVLLDKSTKTLPDTCVNPTGGLDKKGDWIAWVATDGTRIQSITIPDWGTSGPTNPWVPYAQPVFSGNMGYSGPLNSNLAGGQAAPKGTSVPYSIKLQGVAGGIYGRIIIDW
jgi:hypothetical protein